MRRTVPFHLVEGGSLVRPGPLGRLLRLGLGVFCLNALYEITTSHADLIQRPFSALGDFALLIALALCVFGYVVNIGFGRSWGQRPLVVAVLFLLLSGGVAFLRSGSFDSPIFGVPLMLWLGYSYGHLGISFVLASLIATPGCEMRAIPELAGRVTGRTTAEHPCPAAFISKIDEWEQRLRRRP